MAHEKQNIYPINCVLLFLKKRVFHADVPMELGRRYLLYNKNCYFKMFGSRERRDNIPKVTHIIYSIITYPSFTMDRKKRFHVWKRIRPMG